MCFGRSPRLDRRGRSESPQPRPARRRRHSQEISDPASSSTRRRRRQRGPEVTRHHARRSSTLVFEGEPSSIQTPKRRSRKGSDEPEAKGRHRRHRPTTRIRSWAADIPEDVEDVEDPDPSVEILTRKQGKQPESESESKGKTTTKDEASKSPVQSVHSGISSESEETPENIQTESSKAAANTGEPIQKTSPKSSISAGLTDAQKAAAARKLPEAKKTDGIVESKSSKINERNAPPVPDSPGSSALKSHPSSVINNKASSDMAEHTGPSSSSIRGPSRGKN